MLLVMMNLIFMKTTKFWIAIWTILMKCQWEKVLDKVNKNSTTTLQEKALFKKNNPIIVNNIIEIVYKLTN